MIEIKKRETEMLYWAVYHASSKSYHVQVDELVSCPAGNIIQFSTLQYIVEVEYEIYLISSPSLLSKCTFYNFVDFKVSIKRNFDVQNRKCISYLSKS